MPVPAKKTTTTRKAKLGRRGVLVSRGILSRIEAFADHMQLSIPEFERLCDIPKGTLGSIKFRQKNSTNPKIDAVLYVPSILKNFSIINARWLILGEGEMFEPASFDRVTKGDKNFFKALLTTFLERSRRMSVATNEFQSEIDNLIKTI